MVQVHKSTQDFELSQVLKNVYTIVAAKGERERDIHMWTTLIS
jgi:hypothetical protein